MTEHHNTETLGRTHLFYGNVAMVVPAGGGQVRQAEIRLPLFSGPPAVTATVFSPQSPGEAFVIYNIEVNQLGQQTQIVFSATNVETGVPSNLNYWCSYVVVGPA
jgi:hypothetical protein